ncbi:MAG: hypothetical protein U0229_07920 [Anaeromyxobacter sp.]
MVPDPRSGARLAVALAALALAACSVDVSVPQGAKVSCGGDADCPGGFRCNASTGACVPSNASDLTAPVVLSVTVAPAVAGLAPGGGHDPLALTLVTDEVLAGTPRVFFEDGATERSFGALALDATQPATGHRYLATYAPTGAETQASFPLRAVLEDAVGNRFAGTLAASVAFDFVAPEVLAAPAELAPTVVLLPDPSQNPLAREVAQVTRVANATTRVLVSFTASEDVGPPALHTSPATGLAFKLFGRAGNTWTFEVDWAATAGALGGSYDVVASLVDAAGNATDATLPGTKLSLDNGAPGEPDVVAARAIRLVRAPWGGPDGAAGLFLEGEEGAVEPGAWVLVYSDAGATRELGRAQSSAKGAFGGPSGTPRFVLASGDLDQVFLRVADAAGNLSGGGVATRVRDVLWRATLGGKLAGDPLSNPHRAFTTPWLAPFRDQRVSDELPGAALATAEGTAVPASGGGTWWQLDTLASSSPEGRTRQGIAYDPVSGTTYVAGGYRDGSSGGEIAATCKNSAYGYANSFPFAARGFERRWRLPVPSALSSSPSPGTARLVFDGTRDVLMLRQGSAQYRWDGAAWISECGTQACQGGLSWLELPGSALWFDPVARLVRAATPADLSFNPAVATWSWDGSRWSETCTDATCLATRPSGPPAGASFDDRTGELVAFGLGVDRRETWSFDGARWKQLCTAEPCLSSRPPARVRAAMVYDRARGEHVLFGGNTTGTACTGAYVKTALPAGAPLPDPAFQDTWTFDGATWTQRGGAGPGPRYDHAMVWDGLRGKVILTGGTYCDCFGYQGNPGVWGDVWTWDGTAWAQDVDAGGVANFFLGTPPGSTHHAAALDPTSGRPVMRGGKLGTDLWTFRSGRWWVRTGVGDPGLSEAPLASPTPNGGASPLAPVTFAGSDPGGFQATSAGAWQLVSDVWAKACGATGCETGAPSPRYLHAMAGDGAGVIAFGGSDWLPAPSGGGPPTGGPPTTKKGDTWRLVPPAGWTQLCTAPGCAAAAPPARVGPAMASPAAGQVLLFGGATSLAVTLGDTWLWNGTSWAPGTSAQSPPARTGHTLVTDPGRGVVVLYGGSDLAGSDYTGNPADGFFVTPAQHLLPAGYDVVWEWKADTWQPVPSLAPRPRDTPPGARSFHAAAWDPDSGGMLVNGGAPPPAIYLWGVNTAHDGEPSTWLWDPEPAGSPALVARFNAATAGSAVRPLVSAVEARWVGTASGKAGASPVTTAGFKVWDRTGWRAIPASACGAGCRGFDTSTGVGDLDARRIQRIFTGNEVILAVQPDGTNGAGLDRATLDTDYLELGLWYRWP